MGIKVMLLACMVMLFTAVSAQAAPEFYVSVTGSIQGPFKGEVLMKGFEGKFAGRNFDFAVVSPRDPQTGMLSGKPMHKPIRIQKAWGSASLQLYSAQLRGEQLTVAIDFVTQDQSGVMVLDHTIKLTGATVASFSSDSEIGQLPVSDTIELVFQKAEIVDHKTKIMVPSN